jgi:hypothetical protein
MHLKHLNYTVAIALGVVIYTAPVVLSAPVTPIAQMSQHDSKSIKPAPCVEVTGRTGADVVSIRHNSMCLDGQNVPAVAQLQPYTVAFALDGTQVWLGLPCSRTLECGMSVFDPPGQGGMEPIPILLHSSPMDDTVLTAGRGEALGKANRGDFARLITERETSLQMNSSPAGYTAAGSSAQIFWDRLLNLGPLVLLLLEKLLGRL